MAQKQYSYAIGLFGGLTSTFTHDEGILSDQRYQNQYKANVKLGGLHAGIDFEGFGFMIDPQFLEIGQSFSILNTQGGQVGERAIRLSYLQIPITYKKHIIDLSFFKVSWVLGVSYGFLLNGAEHVSHSESKLKFPLAVYPELPPSYTIEYDGVVSPVIANLKTVNKNDFISSQLFGSFGFRSDWDVTDNARISIDLRGNVGVFEPRSGEYLNRTKSNLTIYEKSGPRRDYFASLTIGYSRYVSLETKSKRKKVKPFVTYGPKRNKPK